MWELLKTLYEVLGASYPRASIIVASVTGALLFGGGWWLLGKQYEKQRAAGAPAGRVATTPAPLESTTGTRRHEESNRNLQTDSTSYEYFRGPYAFDPAGADAASRPILNELDTAKRKADAVLVDQLRDRAPVERLRIINDYTFKVFRHMRFVQQKWFQANGRFFQGKPTMNSPPSHLLDGKVELPFGLTDQVDDWRDIGYADRVAPVQLRCDVYEGPKGHGYIVTASFRVNGEVWRNEMHVGSERRGVSQYLWMRQGI